LIHAQRQIYNLAMADAKPETTDEGKKPFRPEARFKYSDVPDLIEMLRSKPLGMTRTYPSKYSTWEPNFTNMEYVVTECFEKVMISKYASSELENMITVPEVKLYYFTLSMYTICNRMVQHDLATESQADFVEWMNSRYELGSLPIDGIMKIFFQALSSCTPEDPKFNDVIPAILSVSDHPLTAQNFYTVPDAYVARFPAIEGIFRALF